MLSLILVTLAARLLADLTSLRLVPIFRLYLFALTTCLLFLGSNPTPAWMGLAMLAIKIPVTFEMIRLLYSGVGKKEMRSVWVYSIAVGLIASYLVLGLQQQPSLSHRDMTYVRQVGQVFLAALALAMILHWWVQHYRKDFGALHGCLLTAMWINYAVIGIVRAETDVEWFSLADIWSETMIVLIFTWIILTRLLRPARNPVWRLRIIRQGPRGSVD